MYVIMTRIDSSKGLLRVYNVNNSSIHGPPRVALASKVGFGSGTSEIPKVMGLDLGCMEDDLRVSSKLTQRE